MQSAFSEKRNRQRNRFFPYHQANFIGEKKSMRYKKKLIMKNTCQRINDPILTPK